MLLTPSKPSVGSTRKEGVPKQKVWYALLNVIPVKHHFYNCLSHIYFYFIISYLHIYQNFIHEFSNFSPRGDKNYSLGKVEVRTFQ